MIYNFYLKEFTMGSTKSIPSIKLYVILIEYEQKYSIKTLYKRKQDFIPLDLFLKYNQCELNNLGKDYLVKNNISFCYYKKSDITYYFSYEDTITNCGLTAHGLIFICLQKTNGYLSLLYNRFYLEMEEYLRFDKNPIVIVTAINSINSAHTFVITKKQNDYILSQSSSYINNIYKIKHTQFTFKELQKYLLDDYIESMYIEDKMQFPTFLWRKVIFN